MRKAALGPKCGLVLEIKGVPHGIQHPLHGAGALALSSPFQVEEAIFETPLGSDASGFPPGLEEDPSPSMPTPWACIPETEPWLCGLGAQDPHVVWQGWER